MEVTLRRPKKTDQEAVNAFFHLMVQDTFAQNGFGDLRDLIAEEIQEKVAYLQSDFDSEGEERLFLIADLNGEIVGTIEFGRASQLIHECTDGKLDNWFEIGTVYVHPDFQKQGISRLLFEGIRDELRSRRIDRFCFDSGYPIAQKIWTKRYGEPEYHLVDFWGPGSDHMIWTVVI